MKNKKNERFALVGVGLLLLLFVTVLVSVPLVFNSSSDESNTEPEPSTLGVENDNNNPITKQPKVTAPKPEDANEDKTEDTNEVTAVVANNTNSNVNNYSSYVPTPAPQPQPQPQQPAPTPQPTPEPTPEPEEEVVVYNTYTSSKYPWSFKYNSKYGTPITEYVTPSEYLPIDGEVVSFTKKADLFISAFYDKIIGFGSGGDDTTEIPVVLEYKQFEETTKSNQTFNMYQIKQQHLGNTDWYYGGIYWEQYEFGVTRDRYRVSIQGKSEVENFNQQENEEEIRDIVKSITLEQDEYPVSFTMGN